MAFVRKRMTKAGSVSTTRRQPLEVPVLWPCHVLTLRISAPNSIRRLGADQPDHDPRCSIEVPGSKIADASTLTGANEVCVVPEVQVVFLPPSPPAEKATDRIGISDCEGGKSRSLLPVWALASTLTDVGRLVCPLRVSKLLAIESRNDLHAPRRRASPLQRGRHGRKCFSPRQRFRRHSPGTRWRPHPSRHGWRRTVYRGDGRCGKPPPQCDGTSRQRCGGRNLHADRVPRSYRKLAASRARVDSAPQSAAARGRRSHRQR